MAAHSGLHSPRLNPVLVYLGTRDWYFISHRVSMALAAQRASYDVHVITHVDKDRAAIEALGFHVHPVQWRRGSINPFAFFGNIAEVRRLYRTLSPDLVHHVALQPTVVGSLAATGLSCARLNALAGLGVVFTSATLRARLARPVFRALLRYILADAHASVLVQNPDDRAAIKRLGVADERIFTIRGSGVETDNLRPPGEQPEPVTVGFVGRLLADKGVRSLVTAHDILARQGRPMRLLIGGERNPANPASIPLAEIESWRQRPGIEVLGHVTDIAKFWASAHIAVLPSRREGLPKSLLEAAACCRPIVATNVPGCREIARESVNALLVPPDNAQALADAITLLAADKGLTCKFGEAGRRLVENEFSANRIGSETVALYDRLSGRMR